MSDEDPLVKVARDLTEIVAMCGDLADQAAHKAADKAMPGGKALVSLAPVASPQAWEYVYESREELGRNVDHIEDEEQWEPPLQTLLFWSEAWRVEHGRESDRRPTVGTEADFLRGILQWAYEHEPRWEDFTRDVRAARLRLEGTLYAGTHPERTPVPCIEDDCRQPRLIRVYRQRVADDGYKCPACKAWYTPERFTLAKAAWLDSEGAERWVSFRLARSSVDRPERTMRDWLHGGLLASYCDLRTREVYVWWPDVRQQNEASPTRTRHSA